MTDYVEPHTVSAVFTFKNNECKEKFVDFCNGDNGLSVTRNWNGCQSIECFETHDNPNRIVIWQKWDNRECHESYVKHRHEDGSFEFLHELIVTAPEINPLRPVVFKTDKQQIEEIVKDMCYKDHTLGMSHMNDNCVFVRPSGNPLTKHGWNDMMNNSDAVVDSSELQSINRLTINGNMAFVCYTSHVKFTYKGVENDDVAVFTSVLEKGDGKWGVIHGQRSTGRKPDEEPPKF